MTYSTKPVLRLIVAIAVVGSAGHLSADPPDNPGGAEKSLDEQLLEGLDNDLLGELDALPDLNAADPDKPKTNQDESPLDRDLVDQLIEGDDIGAAEEADPHLRIGQRMQLAQDRIRARKTAATTQRLQQQIIDDLDRLIEQVRKAKCCGGGEGNPQAGLPGPSKSGQASSANAQSKQPARDGSPQTSTQRVEQSESAETAITRYRALVKQVWGHLPERVRERMPNTSREEFLPKYEELIEDYFQRLSEETRDGL